jgi:hypothetical protein
MNRGTYRATHTALFDDPDYEKLSPEARHVFLALRLGSQSNIACIYRLRLSVLSENTGYPLDTLSVAIKELKSGHWIFYDGQVVWIRNGLRYDPTITLSNPKHKSSIEKAVFGVPKCEIVKMFCDYYGLECPFDTHEILMPMGSDTVSPPNPIPIPKPTPKPIPKKSPSLKAPDALDDDFNKFMEAYPNPPGYKRTVKSETLKKFKALVKSGVPAADLIRAASNYAISRDVLRDDGKYVRGAQVFLGPQKFWEPYAEAGEPEPEPEERPGYKPTAEDLEALAKMR